MTEIELQQARRKKWRLDGNPIRTIEDAREFIDSVGLCVLFPVAPQETKGLGRSLVGPTFVGACIGANENLPTLQRAFADSRAQSAIELMVRLLRERAAYEANLFGDDNSFLVAASVFPYFYALVGDRNPQKQPQPKTRRRAATGMSPLAEDVLAMIHREGPIAKPGLRELLGGELSIAALDRALAELWSRLSITRVDYNPKEGAAWDILYRWSPEPVNEGAHLSIAASLSALVSRYLDTVIAAEASEIEDFFSPVVARSRVKEAVNALLAAREFSFVHVGNRTLLQVTPAREDTRPRARRA
jgi:23S rRNA pseudouridine2605 synthase